MWYSIDMYIYILWCINIYTCIYIFNMLYVYNYTLDHICLMLFFWSIMLTFSRSKDWLPMGLEACWTLPEQSSCWFCLEVYQPLNFCLPQNYVGILKLSETFWAQKKNSMQLCGWSGCECSLGQIWEEKTGVGETGGTAGAPGPEKETHQDAKGSFMVSGIARFFSVIRY